MYINSKNIVHLGKSSNRVTAYFNSRNEKYWYATFFSNEDLEKIKNSIPPDITHQIKAGKIKLLLDNINEDFYDVVFFIYKFFVFDLCIPPTQILLLSESATLDEVVWEVSSLYDADPINVSWVRRYEEKYALSSCPEDKNLATLEFKEYPKKFLNLNRRWRLHRPVFVGLLRASNLINEGYVSLQCEVEGSNWNDVWLHLESPKFKDSYIYKLLSRNKKRIEEMGDLRLDLEDLNSKYEDPVRYSKLDHHYLNTYFSVVTDTNFFEDVGGNNGICLNEKIFKPVLKKHPFILMSRPGALEKFKSIGYKTFHPYINEDYDTEIDDHKRMIMILKEVKRLCLLPSDSDKFKHFLNEMSKIVKYNQDVLFRKKSCRRHWTFIKECFINELIGS